MKLDLKSAVKLMKEKDEPTMEYETAVKWTQNAAACYQLSYQAKEKGNKEEWAYWLKRGTELSHEAYEHSALVMDYGKTVGEVQKKLEEFRSLAEEWNEG